MHLFFLFVVYAILVYFMITLRRGQSRPPQNGEDGGEPLIQDLPDLDLPPGICLPIDGDDRCDRRWVEEEAFAH